jgi:PEP-CTERM motif
MKKLAYLFPVVALALVSVVAKADPTLTDNQSNGTSIGPYSMLLGSTSLALFCLDDQLEITKGESWGVEVVTGDKLGTVITGFGSATLIKEYEDEAFLYSLYNGSNATAVQDALWSIFDPHNGSLFTSASVALLSELPSSFTSSFLSGYTFYLYDGDGTTGGGGLGAPQNFIGTTAATTTPAPEPSSLILLGTGLLGVAGAARRKLRRS